MRCFQLLLFEQFKVKFVEESVLLYVFAPIDHVSVPLRQIMLREMPNQTLRVRVERLRKGYFLAKNHLEYFIGVLMHEGRPTEHELVNEYAEGIPVGCATMALIQDDFRSHILRCPAQSIGSLPRPNLLHEAIVGHLYVAVVLHKHIFWLEVPVDQIFAVEVLEAAEHGACVESSHVGLHLTDSLQHF
jgi:hypothetical protein